MIPAARVARARDESISGRSSAMTELEPAMIRVILARRGSDDDETAKAEARLARRAARLRTSSTRVTYLAGDRVHDRRRRRRRKYSTARGLDVMPDSAHAPRLPRAAGARPAKRRAYGLRRRLRFELAERERVRVDARGETDSSRPRAAPHPRRRVETVGLHARIVRAACRRSARHRSLCRETR